MISIKKHPNKLKNYKKCIMSIFFIVVLFTIINFKMIEISKILFNYDYH